MRLCKILLALGSALLSLSTAYAGIPNTDHPTTFLGPTLRGGFTSAYDDNAAYSLLGEVGVKNYRVGGTLGWRLMENQRFKVSAEYLWQDINYAFFSGNTKRWVQQGAVGAGYRYDLLQYDYNPSLDLNAYYSHAPSKTLSPKSGTFINGAGVFLNYTDFRRIAGSNAAGISPGLSASPWIGGRVGLELNYDNVRYNKFSAPSKDAKGFGGTIKVKQVLTQQVDLNLLAAVRQPFNNYQAQLAWNDFEYYGKWNLGLDGAYTAGKNTLPSTWNVGISANYLLDQRCDSTTVRLENAQRFANLKGEVPIAPVSDDLLAWTADPAVYMPQVLAIPDDRVNTTNPACVAPIPTVIGTIPAQSLSFGVVSVINGAAVFTPASGLTYTVTTAPNPAPSTVTIDPTTGLITLTSDSFNGSTTVVTVTATNACGVSASTTFPVEFIEIPR